MASQTCEQCGSIVAGDEQFCPSCGAFMDPMDAPKPRPKTSGEGGNVISVSSDGPADSPYEEFSLNAPPPDDTPPRSDQPQRDNANQEGNSGQINCPSCGAVNPANNRHCQECGARLRQGPLPTAPRPAVQATAGVRAALAISGLLLVVILIALFFNAFTSDDPEAAGSTTTTSTTTPTPAATGPIEILEEVCTPEGIGAFRCSNLTSGTAEEYQVSWEENAEQGVTISLSFLQPMAIVEIRWTNIEDATRFRQNFRAQSITILAQDSVAGPVPVELQDQQGTQAVPYVALSTSTLEIHIVDTYTAQVVAENVFGEIAINEIEIIGRPVIAPTATTIPSDTSSTTAGE